MDDMKQIVIIIIIIIIITLFKAKPSIVTLILKLRRLEIKLNHNKSCQIKGGFLVRGENQSAWRKST